ncbi:hypothetical protein ACRE_066770 [Hapsidospora chrysogenum ATCC 11550]|uniref:Uncharacterized protein n=1 Tax=Hapsidospora chrysogenum (strain ATCC 11550 / CBS 779.69 / DSM 880 / IAM 14645 / JCM 23072 / IMI 49137) TaxID=857340 RepID=A0A086SZR7_HAPC1|nr:hypothetical protein ACRE_066770 [Hapsidospora chrysogenum ATCC 11550]
MARRRREEVEVATHKGRVMVIHDGRSRLSFAAHGDQGDQAEATAKGEGRWAARASKQAAAVGGRASRDRIG